uniref:Golgi membrane protein 1 n=1 Tax=Anolis carolinensis TaxID=28377 RepID=G1K8H1_ANOCA|nr:PREDICTED: Golgi membrane protein 1 [Anolis carolinensis]|eukprot:XP_003216565.1 PREDICTED: Golgi membrane protein 1 [Anolis carolinensis]
MMVGLGNSRRGMKSPPLLVAALVACIIVLGFNYWIASSRSVDLQNRIMELESRVRRAAAERGAVELKKNEFQGELQKQREQIDKIQSIHNFQMESTNKIHRDEKAMLLNNITVSDRLIQNLKEQLEDLQQEYGKLQMDVYKFQKNQTNLQKKFTYDMSQCISQMKELKEQCEERIAEISRKGNEVSQEKEKKNISNVSDKNDHVPMFRQPEFQNRDLTKQGNELEDKHHISENSLILEASKPALTVKNVPELDDHREKGGTNDDITTAKGELAKEDQDHPQIPAKPSLNSKELSPEPGMHQNPYETVRDVNGEDAVERQTDKLPETMSYQNNIEAKADDEEIEREQLLNDDLQQDDQEPSKDGEFRIQRVNQDAKRMDYNLDMNEAESETDKQAALVDQQNNLIVPNHEDPKLQNDLFNLQDHQQKL